MQERTEEVSPVGLEYQQRSQRRKVKHYRGAAGRPHWTDLTLRTDVLLGDLFPYADFRSDHLDEGFLWRLYSCFKTPLELDKLVFNKTCFWRAEREIHQHINRHFAKAYNIYELPPEYCGHDNHFVFHVMWDTLQPAKGFHALYINDVYSCKDPLVQEVVFYGLHIMCWHICYGSWHGATGDHTEHVSEQWSSELDELKRLENLPSKDDNDKAEIARIRKEAKTMEKELTAYERVAFGRNGGITPVAYRRLINKVDIKRYPQLVHWANTIHRLYNKGIRIIDYIPVEPEQVLITPVDYNYIALKPGYVADNYEGEIDSYARDCASGLFRIEAYTSKEVIKLPNVNWKHITSVLFGLNIRKLAYSKQKTLLNILI